MITLDGACVVRSVNGGRPMPMRIFDRGLDDMKQHDRRFRSGPQGPFGTSRSLRAMMRLLAILAAVCGFLIVLALLS